MGKRGAGKGFVAGGNETDLISTRNRFPSAHPPGQGRRTKSVPDLLLETETNLAQLKSRNKGLKPRF